MKNKPYAACRILLLAVTLGLIGGSLYAQSAPRIVGFEMGTYGEKETHENGGTSLSIKVNYNRKIAYQELDRRLQIRLVSGNGAFVTSKPTSHTSATETAGPLVTPTMIDADSPRNPGGSASTFEGIEFFVAKASGIFEFQASIDGFRTTATTSVRLTLPRASKSDVPATSRPSRRETIGGQLSFCDVLKRAIRELPSEFTSVRDESTLSDHEAFIYWRSTLAFPGAKANLSTYTKVGTKVEAVVSYNRPTKVSAWHCIARSEVSNDDLPAAYLEIVSQVKDCLGDGWEYKEFDKRSCELFRDNTRIDISASFDNVHVYVRTRNKFHANE